MNFCFAGSKEQTKHSNQGEKEVQLIKAGTYIALHESSHHALECLSRCADVTWLADKDHMKPDTWHDNFRVALEEEEGM